MRRLTRRATAAPSPTATRKRILQAAIARFARHSYEETGLRDIAADVGLDVAYVHRCFGSKERLFAEALEAAVEPARLRATDRDELSRWLARQVLVRDPAGSGEVGPLDIVIHSVSSPEAARVLRDFLARDILAPLAGKLGREPGLRPALIVALLAGVGILRNVLGVAPLAEGGEGELERLIVQAIDGLMDRSAAAEPAWNADGKVLA